MLRMIATALGVIMFAVPALADSDMPQHPHEYACYWVHGRYVIANGSGVRRIWIIGTHRVVHMYDEDMTALPPPLDRQTWNSPDLYGDFRICPLARDIPGHSRPVRIRGVRRLVVGG